MTRKSQTRLAKLRQEMADKHSEQAVENLRKKYNKKWYAKRRKLARIAATSRKRNWR